MEREKRRCVSIKFAYNDCRCIKCRYIPILYLDLSNKHFPKMSSNMLLYSSVVISRLTCIKCYTVKVVSLREAVLSQSITQLGVIVNRIA